jgi:diacylglycerol kinase (ATP)
MQLIAIIFSFLAVGVPPRSYASEDSVRVNSTGSQIPDAACDNFVYIFLNPGSGGGKGAELASAGIRRMRISVGESHVTLTVYDLRDGETGKKPGFIDVANLINNNTCIDFEHPVRIIAAGGDGTVVWAMSESVQYGIDIEKMAFGTIPFGTGNDFSKVYGWGSDPPKNLIENQLKELKKLLLKWLSADLVAHDLWNVRIRIDPNNGRILQHSGNQLRRIPMSRNGGTLEKKMGIYFSLGVESRIGFDFDGSRTSKRSLNKAVYAWMGYKRLVDHKSYIGKHLEMCSDGNETLFTAIETSKLVPSLLGNPSSLIFLNINSFAAGLDVWGAASKLGVRNPRRSEFDPQNAGDGKLEVLAFHSLLGLAAERLRRRNGNGYRIGQSRGPFVLKFRDIGSFFRVYMQVDGEYYQVEKPESVEISHNMSVRVLRNRTP